MTKKTVKQKNLTGIVVSVDKTNLKYTLASQKKVYRPGTKLEIKVNDKIETAKLPDGNLDFLKKSLLDREVEYSYIKNTIEKYPFLHNWEYKIKTVDSKDSFEKNYSLTL
jgi:hypothetical protein